MNGEPINWEFAEGVNTLPMHEPATRLQLSKVADAARDILYGDERYRVRCFEGPVRAPLFAVTYIDGPHYVTLTARDETKRPDVDIAIEQRYNNESDLVIASIFEVINSSSFMRRRTTIHKSSKYKLNDKNLDLDKTIPIHRPKILGSSTSRSDYRKTRKLEPKDLEFSVGDYVQLTERLWSYNPNERVYAVGDEVLGLLPPS